LAFYLLVALHRNREIESLNVRAFHSFFSLYVLFSFSFSGFSVIIFPFNIFPSIFLIGLESLSFDSCLDSYHYVWALFWKPLEAVKSLSNRQVSLSWRSLSRPLFFWRNWCSDHSLISWSHFVFFFVHHRVPGMMRDEKKKRKKKINRKFQLGGTYGMPTSLGCAHNPMKKP
jgi:hypothetical protein